MAQSLSTYVAQTTDEWQAEAYGDGNITRQVLKCSLLKTKGETRELLLFGYLIKLH